MLLYSLFILFTLLQLVLHVLFNITYFTYDVLLYFYCALYQCIIFYHSNCKFYWIHKGLSVTFVNVCCGDFICIEYYENKKQTTIESLFDLYSQYFKGNDLF